MKFILAKKLGMSRIFDDKGISVPVTLVEAEPCSVTQIKTKDVDGYESIQIGSGKIKENKIKKTQKTAPYKFIKEFRGNIDFSQYKKDGLIDLSSFAEGEKVKISGFSKGKGFAGGVKRWNFKGKVATHGTKHEERKIGSTGCRFPQRVIKGRKMPGRLGYERVSVKNLKVVKIDKENNLMALKGAVPGRKGTLLEIRSDK